MTRSSFGPRLSTEEYERRIVQLHSGRDTGGGDADDELVRRAELDLAIDYRLGRDFPSRRREALWDAQQRLERKRLRTAFRALVGRLFDWREGVSSRLASEVLREYGKELSPAEMNDFLGLGNGDARRASRKRGS